MEQKVLRAVMVCLLLMSMAILGRETAAYVETVNAVNALRGNNADTDGIPTVVIDAGHGGDDPGKIGINGAPEKDINLRITEKLRQYLEADGIRVVLTRETEDGLYDASAPNKKVQDMKRRIEKIEQTDPVLTVSIHQNSYPEEYVHGAQVFYYNGSSGGEQLAGLIQTQLIQDLDPENHRQIKPNDSYYLLKKPKEPSSLWNAASCPMRQRRENCVTRPIRTEWHGRSTKEFYNTLTGYRGIETGNTK